MRKSTWLHLQEYEVISILLTTQREMISIKAAFVILNEFKYNSIDTAYLN